MFYVLEPQRDMYANEDREDTWFVPCDQIDATVYALFRRENYDDEPEYIGDLTIEQYSNMVAKAQGLIR